MLVDLALVKMMISHSVSVKLPLKSMISNTYYVKLPLKTMISHSYDVKLPLKTMISQSLVKLPKGIKGMGLQDPGQPTKTYKNLKTCVALVFL